MRQVLFEVLRAKLNLYSELRLVYQLESLKLNLAIIANPYCSHHQ